MGVRVLVHMRTPQCVCVCTRLRASVVSLSVWLASCFCFVCLFVCLFVSLCVCVRGSLLCF